LIWLSVFLVALTAGEAAEAGPPLEYSQETLDRLSQGEVIVTAEQSDPKHQGRVQALILIEAPVNLVWRVLLDCEGAPAFVSGLQSCKIMQRAEDTDLIAHQIKLSWLFPRIDYTFRAHYVENERIDFKKESGDVKEFEGSWVLQPLKNGQETMVVYSVFLKPGFFVPQWFVRRALSRDLPQVLINFRNRVKTLSPHS
jgi:ribosome-associated toxin RatA of RatAB toxin-antitoxin module